MSEIQDLELKIGATLAEARRLVTEASDSKELTDIRTRYLGRNGIVTGLLKKMGQLPADLRPEYGQRCNQLRGEVESILDEREAELLQTEKEARLLAEKIDLSLPGRPLPQGSWHPVSLAQEQMESIFLGLGFSIVQGPEVETDYYNFQAMNIPKDHPAREMQDTFYLSSELLLRTHTSPMQARTMEKFAPEIPLKVIVPGKVYRRDEDATHTPMFHQIEGLYIDKNVSLANLKGVLHAFAKAMFGADREIRLRPSFFPFTEPSVEVDISCFQCGGKGCRLCKQSGWIEILGAGMVHPNVLRGSGYDPETVSGFAFGIGIDRVAMLKFGIDDLRLLFANDVRFLAQFH